MRGRDDRLFFTAGPNGENDRLFGRIDPLPEPSSMALFRAAGAAIRLSLNLALKSLAGKPLQDRRRLHKSLAVVAGAAGGAFGVSGLPLELPFSTTIILRSVADIARANILAMKSVAVDRVFNVASGKETSLLGLWQTMQKVTGAEKLAPMLKAMGMTQAFDAAQANFTGLCTQPPDHLNLYISDVLQKAMIAMEETGVEAAAATAVIVAGFKAVAGGPGPIPVNVNRPYLVSIVDVPTGAVLFLGHIVDPTQTGS